MLISLLIASALQADPNPIKTGAYEKCTVTAPGIGSAEAPWGWSITIHEIQNYTHNQISGRFAVVEGRVEWESGPLKGQPPGVYSPPQPGRPAELQFSSVIADQQMEFRCAWTQE